MSKKDPARCPHCDATMVEYSHRLSCGILFALVRLYETAKTAPFPIRELDLSHPQMSNFQKLQYWGLAEMSKTADDRKGGVWAVTLFGESFVHGHAGVKDIAVTYRGKVQRLEGDEVSISSVLEGYQYRGEFKDQAKESGAEDPTPMML